MGFEFVRQYAERGWRVIATARQPDSAENLQVLARRFSNVVIERLDVTVEEQILALSLKYANEPIDVLINNAGTKGARTQLSASYEHEEFEAVLQVNASAPLRVSQAFLPSVRQGRHRKIVVVYTSLGSVCGAMNWGDGIQGDTMYYPISKAAVNMGMTIFAAQVAEEDIRVGLLAPGGVLTDMLRQSRPDTTGAIPPEEAVRGMIALIDTLDASARLIDLDGDAAGC